jgi:hypothetical protein
MPKQNMLNTSAPKPSRFFQMDIIKNFDVRFNDILYADNHSVYLQREHVIKTRSLLSDIKHVLIHQFFDKDVRLKLIERAGAIIKYIDQSMYQPKVSSDMNTKNDKDIFYLMPRTPTIGTA